jgi:hypothetical protein
MKKTLVAVYLTISYACSSGLLLDHVQTGTDRCADHVRHWNSLSCNHKSVPLVFMCTIVSASKLYCGCWNIVLWLLEPQPGQRPSMGSMIE